VVLSVRQYRVHLDDELCCCSRCNLELGFAECAGDLIAKPVIDRLGRKSTRCVKRDEGEIGAGERHPELIPKQEGTLAETQRRETIIGAQRGLRSIGVDSSRVNLNDTITGQAQIGEIVDSVKAELTQRLDQSNARGMTLQNVIGRNGWASSSVNDSAQILHAAVGIIFDGDDSVFDKYAKENPSPSIIINTPDPETSGSVADQLDRSMAVEQAFWREKIGPGNTIRMYRGLLLEGQPNPELGPNTIQEFPASSWSISPDVAQRFADTIGTIVARDVPIEEIIASTFSYGLPSNELEFILHTPEEGVDVEVIQ